MAFFTLFNDVFLRLDIGPYYRLLIHVLISRFTYTQFSLEQSKAQLNKQLRFARSQIRHFAGKPEVAQPVNRLSLQGRVKKSREEGFVHLFTKQRTCSQSSGSVAKCRLFSQVTKIQVKSPAVGLSQSREGEALRLPQGWKLQPSHTQICPLYGVNSEFSPLVSVSLTLQK